MTTADENYDDLEDDGGLSGFWILVIFLIVLAAFAGIVYIAYQKGIQQRAANDSDLPVITASADPVREEVELAPVEGGRQEVIDELNDTEPSRVIANVDEDSDPLDGYQQAPSQSMNVPTQDEVRTAANDTTSNGVSASTPAVNTQPRTQEPVPTPKPREPDPKPASNASASTAAAASVGSGTHTVQVGAFGSRDEAMEQYGSLMSKLGPLVGNHAPEVQNAVVNGREYNRLWIGQFANYEAASAYCDQLKSRGQDCLVRKR